MVHTETARMQALVLGGTEDHILLIRALQRRGYRVVLVDYCSNPPAKSAADEHVQESTLEKDAVLAIARDRRVDLVLALCIDQAVLTMAYVSEKLGLPCHLSHRTARTTTNKGLMKRMMVDCGLPTTRFATLIPDDDIDSMVTGLAFPVVVKPADSNSSKGITRADGRSALNAAIPAAREHSRSDTVVVEEFVEGPEYSADLFLRGGEPTLMVATRTFKTALHPEHFVICNSMCPTDLSERDVGELLAIVREMAKHFGIPDGPLFSQCIRGDRGLRILEFNARIGGGSRHHFIRFACKTDYLEQVVDFCLGAAAAPEPAGDGAFYGCQFAYARPGVMRHVDGLQECRAEGLILDYYLYRSLGTHIVGNNSSAHRPLGTVVRGESLEDLREKVHAADSRMRILDDEGRDILIHGLHFPYGDDGVCNVALESAEVADSAGPTPC